MVNEINLEYRKLIYQRLFPRKKLLLLMQIIPYGMELLERMELKVSTLGITILAYFFYFQHILKYASASGIILALVSKNNLEDIKLAFENIKMP